MSKTAYLNARVEPELKADAESIFRNLGLTTSDAVTIFLRQVVLHRGFPFPVREPNEETIEALGEDAADLVAYSDARAMMAEVLDEAE